MNGRHLAGKHHIWRPPFTTSLAVHLLWMAVFAVSPMDAQPLGLLFRAALLDADGSFWGGCRTLLRYSCVILLQVLTMVAVVQRHDRHQRTYAQMEGGRPWLVDGDDGAPELPSLGRSQFAAGSGAACEPYFAYYGREASYKGYLNEEFHLLLQGLASPRFRWRHISVDKPPKETTWLDVEEASGRQHGCAPSALLFVIKFHWEFANLVQLGPRVPGVLDNTMM